MLFSELDLDIRPGYSLGVFKLGWSYSTSFIPVNAQHRFTLGASLWTVLDLLRTHKHTFPQVDVQYDPDSSTTPVILHIRPHFDLLFSGTHQRLHTIAVRRLRDPNPPLTLRYKGNILSSPEKELRRVNVNLAFGPTYAGEDLRYPGVRFCFDDEGLRDKAKQHEDRSQEVIRLLITQTDPSGGELDALSEVPVSPVIYGELAEAIAKVSRISLLVDRA